MLNQSLPCSASIASGSVTRSETVGIHPDALPVARHTSLGSVQPLSSSLNAAAMGVNIQPFIGAA
jgi:hypothetical protein